jgi:predicted AlkP superfamily phosphohydrolase/phosphomutase
VKRKLKIAGLWTRTRFAPDGLERPIFDNIDWERTLAYVPSFSGFPGGFADIFLSPNITDEQVAALCDDLRRQVNPKNGKPLIDEIYTNEVYGTGPYTLQEPHLLLLPNKGMTFRLELGNESLWEDLDKSFGAHHKNGVLYAYGKPFKRNFRAPNAEIYDLVPTILRTMSLPLPHTFDGKVLDELFIEKLFGELSPTDEGGLTRRKLQKLLGIQ